MELHIVITGRKDLAVQLYQQLREAIASGRLAAGAQLPPSRLLAEQLGISRKTVSDTYATLTYEGLLVGKTGSGTFVNAWAPQPGRVQTATDLACAANLAKWASLPSPMRHPTRDSTLRYEFIGGATSRNQFPQDEWRRCTQDALRRIAQHSGFYSQPEGLPALRSAIAGHIAFSRGVKCRDGDIVVTNGAQQALDLIARVVLEPGTIVAMEDPGYSPARQLFMAMGARVASVPVDEDGIQVEGIPEGTRLIYVTPSHQFPLGMPMSLARREALLARAFELGAIIIEDDYDSEFHYDGMPTACVQGLDKHARTIYIGTFGKTLYPGLRMGYMALPQELVRAFVQARSIMDGHTPQIQQLTLARFMEDGHYNSHVRAMRKLYAGRREVILESIGRHLAGIVTAPRPQGGMQVPCLLEPGWSEEDTIRRAAAAGVLLQGLSRLYAGEQRQPGWLLGYASLTAYEIEAAVLRLANALRKP